jgi:hypothetical protein
LVAADEQLHVPAPRQVAQDLRLGAVFEVERRGRLWPEHQPRPLVGDLLGEPQVPREDLVGPRGIPLHPLVDVALYDPHPQPLAGAGEFPGRDPLLSPEGHPGDERRDQARSDEAAGTGTDNEPRNRRRRRRKERR